MSLLFRFCPLKWEDPRAWVIKMGPPRLPSLITFHENAKGSGASWPGFPHFFAIN